MGVRVCHGSTDNESTNNVRDRVSEARIRGLAPQEKKEEAGHDKGRKSYKIFIAFACYYKVLIEFLVQNNPRNITITNS